MPLSTPKNNVTRQKEYRKKLKQIEQTPITIEQIKQLARESLNAKLKKRRKHK